MVPSPSGFSDSSTEVNRSPAPTIPAAQGPAAVSAAVEKLYNAYPFPPDPLLDEPPPGYNWRWYWPAAYSFCAGRSPDRHSVRILDAGCGTGVGTDYLVHLNPEAEVVAVDLSPGAIAVATERLQRSGGDRVHFHTLSLYDLDQIPGEFDLINCVGVLHHLPDPVRGMQALAHKLAPGGLLHIFVYGELGRWEIQLMQQAIALLQGDQRGDYTDGVQIGRQLFATLPDNNRLVKYEKERWAMENQRDECFADMYVHPQEIDYNVKTLFDLIDASGLEFVGFSNPDFWSLERLIGVAPALMERAQTLPERERYRLIELLDPNVPHYEFFLAKSPLQRSTWQNDDELLQAKARRNPCMHGWPSPSLLNQDYRPAQLSESEFELLEAIDNAAPETSIGALLQSQTTAASNADGPKLGLTAVRSLWMQRMIFLAP